MFDAWLSEFLIVAKYLNISHAAQELNMTQPNLSRHLRQMEAELGFALIEHSGNKIALTEAGCVFADKLPRIIKSYKSAVKTCQEVAQAQVQMLRVQIPPYNDEAGSAYLHLLNDVVNASGKYQFDFLSMSRKKYRDVILSGEVSVGVIYMSGTREEAEEELHREGFDCLFLATVPFDVWFSISDARSRATLLSLRDLESITLAFPNNPSYQLKHAYVYLMTSHGLQPRYQELQVNNRLNLISSKHVGVAYLFPRAMRNDAQLTWRNDIKPVPLPAEASMCAFAVTPIGSKLLDE